MFDYSDLTRSGTAPTLNYGSKSKTAAASSSSDMNALTYQSDQSLRPKTRDITGQGDLSELNTTLRVNRRKAGNVGNTNDEMSESFRKAQGENEFRTAVDRIRKPTTEGYSVDRRFENGYGTTTPGNGSGGAVVSNDSSWTKKASRNTKSMSSMVAADYGENNSRFGKASKQFFNITPTSDASIPLNDASFSPTATTTIAGGGNTNHSNHLGGTSTLDVGVGGSKVFRSREVRKPPTPKFPIYHRSSSATNSDKQLGGGGGGGGDDGLMLSQGHTGGASTANNIITSVRPTTSQQYGNGPYLHTTTYSHPSISQHSSNSNSNSNTMLGTSAGDAATINGRPSPPLSQHHLCSYHSYPPSPTSPHPPSYHPPTPPPTHPLTTHPFLPTTHPLTTHPFLSTFLCPVGGLSDSSPYDTPMRVQLGGMSQPPMEYLKSSSAPSQTAGSKAMRAAGAPPHTHCPSYVPQLTP